MQDNEHTSATPAPSDAVISVPERGPGSDRPAGTASPRLRRAVLALSGILAAAATGAVAFAPWLLVEHPLLLAALAPDGADLVLVSATVDFLPLLAVALPMRTVGVLTAYALGLIYGSAALSRIRSPRARRLIGGLERVLDRAGAPGLIALPAYTVALVAGAAGLQPRRAVPAIVAGQVVAVTAAYYLGSLLAPWTDRVIGFLGEHLLASTLCCLGAVVSWRVWRRMGGPRDPG